MRMAIALLLAVAFAISPLAGEAGEKRITDVKDLAGSWQGRVSGEAGGQAPVTMVIKQDGSYQAATRTGTQTVGKFYLEGGKLRYQSSQSSGSATVSDDRGKTWLTIIPEGAAYSTGPTEYQRMK
jgi:hypothetical protein